MLFNSLEFLVFLALFLLFWQLAKRGNELRWAYLCAASFFFYGWWDWRFLPLIIGSGLLDFYVSLMMRSAPRHRAVLLACSLLGNLGALVVFKYLDFIIENTNSLLGVIQMQPLPIANLLLPVGISFYTFQSMSYTIDVYRGKLEPTSSILHFFAYLSLFPQLVAGPIVRAADLLPQLCESHPVTSQQRWEGLRLIVHGFFKKMVVADVVAPHVNAAFATPEADPYSSYWWVIMTMFAFQIYCDFSGYSNIACGLAKWIGLEFPDNFNHPYIAAGMRDFWSRWHISLSSWFRDYVYIAMGGARRGVVRGHLNLWVTMAVSGIWHGAAWTFLSWGLLHAVYMSIERITRWPERMVRLPMGRLVATLMSFILVVVSWVFFRAESFGQAMVVLSTMANVATFDLGYALQTIDKTALLVTALMISREVYCYLVHHGCLRDLPRVQEELQPLVTAVTIVACIYLRGAGDTFIYFQF
jgi:alginate O-acetyltransferase complex protein AlgI